jgi:hypothetical protein
LIPFTCKGRGFCPSCGGRRMADRAARWVDTLLPRVGDSRGQIPAATNVDLTGGLLNTAASISSI